MRVPVLLALFALPSAPVASALSFTEVIAEEGKEMKALDGWPEGVMAVINHPFRNKGWHFFFSECPNDANYFGLEIETPTDLHRLIKIFAAIKTDPLVLNLDPGEAGNHVEEAGAVFSLGNQPILDQWYKQLPIVKPGVRKFGVHRYTEPPVAQPPTLTLYVGHRAVELRKLRIPPHVTVTTGNSKALREKNKEAFTEIEKFLALREAAAAKKK